jgi:hypothetical protein
LTIERDSRTERKRAVVTVPFRIVHGPIAHPRTPPEHEGLVSEVFDIVWAHEGRKSDRHVVESIDEEASLLELGGVERVRQEFERLHVCVLFLEWFRLQRV